MTRQGVSAIFIATALAAGAGSAPVRATGDNVIQFTANVSTAKLQLETVDLGNP